MCVESVNHSRIKVEENGMKAIFLNPGREKCEVGRIDNCLVKAGIRADYFVSNDSVSVLVELKGCNIRHACEQLFAAAEHQNVKPNLRKKLGFLIVCSRVPSGSTDALLASQKARKRYGARFEVSCRMREVQFTDF